jgi:excisionase family DNA binding protein
VKTDRKGKATMQDAELPKLLTVQEAADYLRVSTRTIRRWTDEKLLEAVRIGHEYRIVRESLPKSPVRGKNFAKS